MLKITDNYVFKSSRTSFMEIKASSLYLSAFDRETFSDSSILVLSRYEETVSYSFQFDADVH